MDLDGLIFVFISLVLVMTIVSADTIATRLAELHEQVCNLEEQIQQLNERLGEGNDA